VNQIPEVPTGDDVKDQEIIALKKLLHQEKSHFQWKKQAINFVALIILIVIGYLRSADAYERCSGTDWGITAAYFIIMATMIVVSVKVTAADQKLKMKFGGINIVKSDLIFEGTVLR